MNDNMRPLDPLAASQFNRPGLLRNAIPLNGFNGSQGRFLPDIAGDFLRVEAVDYPCRISFNNGDQDQAVPLLPGMLLVGPFSGITLWHDDLTTTTTPVRALVTVGRSGAVSEADSFGGFSGQGLPAVAVSATTTVSRRDFIVPYGARQMRIKGANLWGNPTNPFAAQTVILALNSQGVNQSILTIARNGQTYSTTSNRLFFGLIEAVQSGAAQWAYNLDTVVDLPSWAERVICSMTLSAAAASNDSGDFIAVAR